MADSVILVLVGYALRGHSCSLSRGVLYAMPASEWTRFRVTAAREYFDFAPLGEGQSLSLDDFPTLRHVLDFLRGSTKKSEPPVARLMASGGAMRATSARNAPLQPVAVAPSTKKSAHASPRGHPGAMKKHSSAPASMTPESIASAV